MDQLRKPLRLNFGTNEVSDLTTYIPLMTANQYSFYSISSKTSDISYVDSSGVIISVILSLDSKYSSIQRIVYSFMDLVGLIGGISQIWVVFGTAIASIFAYNTYMESLLSKFYRVSKTKSSNDYKNKIIAKEKIPDKNKVLPNDESFNKLRTLKFNSSKNIQTDEPSLSKTTNKLTEWIKQQEGYVFRWKTVLLSLFKFSKFKCPKRNSNFCRNIQISENGRNKIKAEIDLVLL